MGTGEITARGTSISKKHQKIKILGSHILFPFQTSATTAEEANTLKITHYWNSWMPGEEVDGDMATETAPIAPSYRMYLKLHCWKVFILK